MREDFSVFFLRFSDEKPFAISRTNFPLKKLKWEFGVDAKGNDVSAPVRSRGSKAQFSAMPSLSIFMKENGLVSNIRQPANKVAVVEVFKPDTDWLTTYHFSLNGNCWFLDEFQDHSL